MCNSKHWCWENVFLNLVMRGKGRGREGGRMRESEGGREGKPVVKSHAKCAGLC